MLQHTFAAGTVGVPLFFAISGFILALPFAEHYLAGGRRPTLKSYYIRRVTRIEPPYVINLTLLFGMMLLLHGADRIHLLPNYLVSLVYLHNLVYDNWSAIIP